MPLSTKVPEPRPTRWIDAVSGPVEVFAPLSLEDARRGDALRKLRMGMHLSLSEASRLLGIGIVEVSECERGVRTFELHEAEQLLTRQRP